MLLCLLFKLYLQSPAQISQALAEIFFQQLQELMVAKVIALQQVLMLAMDQLRTHQIKILIFMVLVWFIKGHEEAQLFLAILLPIIEVLQLLEFITDERGFMMAIKFSLLP